MICEQTYSVGHTHLQSLRVSILLSRDRAEQLLRYKLSLTKGEVTDIIDAATAFSTIV